MSGTIISSSGCSVFKRYIFVSKRMPVLPVPKRPKLSPLKESEIPEIFKVRDRDLKQYATKLEAVITIYNNYAKEQNRSTSFYDRLEEN